MLLGLGLLVLSGCASGASEALEKRAAAASPTATASPPAGAGGDEKVSGSVAVRLNGFQFLDSGNYVSPKEGMAFLALDVSLRNQGQQEVTVGSRAITLKDATGAELRRNLTAGTKPSPESTLAPGKETRGELTYDVPREAAAFQWAVTVGEGSQPAVFDIKKP